MSACVTVKSSHAGFQPITTLIGYNAHPVPARQALETQRRRGLVTVQDTLAIVVVKIKIQVADGVFIRRSGYGCHTVGTNRHFGPNLSSGGSNPNRSRTCSSTDRRQGSTKILSIFGFSFRYGFNSSIIPGHTLRATPFAGHPRQRLDARCGESERRSVVFVVVRTAPVLRRCVGPHITAFCRCR